SNMFRMNADGELSRFARVSRSSADGARRVSSISLMMDAEYLRKVLGGWDSVRFGADSELIGRAEQLLGDRFLRTGNVGMFCLDLETSLTNDPEFGVSKDTGISPTRQAYRRAYLEWHAGLTEGSARLSFPLTERKF